MMPEASNLCLGAQLILNNLIMALLSDIRAFGWHSDSTLLLRIALTGVVVLVVSALTRVVSALISSATYRDFCREHTWFYQACHKLQKRTVYARFPLPWPTESTYFLLDHVAMRKLFVRSPQLDAFGLARRLHHAVWAVPPIEKYKDIFRAGAKQIHRELSAKNLAVISKTYEAKIIAQVQALRDKVGREGRRIPLHSTFYRFVYDGNMEAIFGPDLPVDETRIVVQNFALNIPALYAVSSVTFIPMSWRQKILPKARQGVKERLLLQDALAKWRINGGLETCSDAWRSIMNVILDNNVDPDAADAWANMVLFGFQGNTAEQPGWFWLYLLQSPRLLEAIKAEVDRLPDGLLLGTDFRKATPLLHSAIHETMRLSTAVFAGREATDTAKIPGCKDTFPKGSLIRIMSRASAFDGSVWGDDPTSFKGDRFMNNTALYNEEMVFGGGVSACPGRFLAQSELELLAAHLIRNIDFGVDSLAIHEKLPPTSKYLEIGLPLPKCEHTTCDIIDLDGTRIVGKYPGLVDAENCMEGISGSLFPLGENTCVLRARDL